MPDTATRLDAARRALDRALDGVVPHPQSVRAAIEDLIAAKLAHMATDAARESGRRTEDHNRPLGS